MDFIPVSSTNIAGLAFSGRDLYIEFLKGGVYRYANVPVDTFRDMLDAESIGKFFHAEIKPKFTFTKIDSFAHGGMV